MPDAETYTSVLQHFARYFDACDRPDVDDVMRILAGATVAVGELETSDPEVVREVYASRMPAPSPDGRRSTKHHVTNLLLEPADGGELLASAYYFRLEPGSDGARVAASGRLRQLLVQDGDGWQVRRHVIVSDF